MQALATLKPGVLTPFSDESWLLWRYYGKPCSAYSLEVDKVFLFKEHVILWQRQALAESRDCHLATAPIILQYQCFTPSVRVLTEELFFRELGNEGDLSLELLCERLGSRLADVLERCGWVIPVLWVPKPIMLLLVQGKWKALVLHMMNSVLNRDAPLFQRHCLNWLRDLMQYPSNGCFSCLWGNRFQQYRSPNHPLTSACALFAMQQLRAHSSAIIADGGPSSQSRLEETLEGLEIFTQSLVENRQAGSHVTGRKAVASRIFDDIRAAHLLRNRGHFKAMKTAMMRSLMPHQLQSLAKAMMYDPLSAPSLSKFQAPSLNKAKVFLFSLTPYVAFCKQKRVRFRK